MVEIINADELVLGRLATYVAKKALQGEKVIVVNAEKAVITGNEKSIKKEYKQKRDRGAFYKGPYFPRMPDRLVKRTIRGMINYKSDRGKKAFKNVRVYIGVPEEFANKEAKTIQSANFKKIKLPKYIRVSELCYWLGARW